MIVVVGHPALRLGTPPAPGGRASEIALEAARRGSRVELIGACGDDRNGDALLIALATAGIGHAATLRDPARATPVLPPAEATDGDADASADSILEPASSPSGPRASETSGHALAPSLDGADVALGLAYLTSFEVLVVTDDVQPSALPEALDAASWSGAHLVLLVADGVAMPDGLPPGSTVLAAPVDDADGAFGTLVGAYAAALDSGSSPSDAFAIATGAAGWEALAGES